MRSEADLIFALTSGDEGALAKLYEALGANVYALALEMLRNREDAEEVLQDTFVKLSNHASSFNPALGSARAYIYTIARNESLMRLRAKRSRPVKANELDVHASDTFFQTVTPTDHDARITVATALEQLSEDESKLLRASFFQGYSHAELAQRTGLPLGTVKSRVRRSLLKLRDYLVDV